MEDTRGQLKEDYWTQISDEYKVKAPFSRGSKYHCIGETFRRRREIAETFLGICLSNGLNLSQGMKVLRVLLNEGDNLFKLWDYLAPLPPGGGEL